MPSWISVNPSSGSGDGTVTVTAAANTDDSSRIGTITITSASGLQALVDVNQAAIVSSIVFSSNSVRLDQTFYADVSGSGDTVRVSVNVGFELLAAETLQMRIGSIWLGLSSSVTIINVPVGDNQACVVQYSTTGGTSFSFPFNIYVECGGVSQILTVIG